MVVMKRALEKVIREDLHEVWSLLSGEEKRLVIDNFEIHNFKKNQVIYGADEEPEYLWALLKGKVKKYKDGVGGRVQILRLIRPVQYFGYRAFFAGERYVSSAGTLEPSTLGTVPLSLVNELIKNNNQLAMFFIHELSRNLGSSDTRIVNLTQKHIRGRLAEALIVLKDNYGYEEDNVTLRIYLAREDLANLSNMTTSNAIRTLSCFVNEKIIIVDGRKIKIINESALRKISKFG
ncbi:MAG: Crp/Fnr family transcriptional regulator [Muribaculaceae bacterium]|nr:Crp/Fnr family transcriptional regulator [Muribaculaceae bacterium]